MGVGVGAGWLAWQPETWPCDVVEVACWLPGHEWAPAWQVTWLLNSVCLCSPSPGVHCAGTTVRQPETWPWAVLDPATWLPGHEWAGLVVEWQPETWPCDVVEMACWLPEHEWAPAWQTVVDPLPWRCSPGPGVHSDALTVGVAVAVIQSENPPSLNAATRTLWATPFERPVIVYELARSSPCSKSSNCEAVVD